LILYVFTASVCASASVILIWPTNGLLVFAKVPSAAIAAVLIMAIVVASSSYRPGKAGSLNPTQIL
jgi:hypothetical protein